MSTLISSGVEVNVEVFFQQEHSRPLDRDFMFAYRITITNLNPFTIQLLNRSWHIFDSTGEYRQVQGEGVIGQQPIIKSLNTFQYVSGCNLHSEMGKMWGKYEMINLENNRLFEVEIPVFQMIAPAKNN